MASQVSFSYNITPEGCSNLLEDNSNQHYHIMEVPRDKLMAAQGYMPLGQSKMQLDASRYKFQFKSTLYL